MARSRRPLPRLLAVALLAGVAGSLAPPLSATSTGDVLFADTFEAGDLFAWDAVVVGGPDSQPPTLRLTAPGAVVVEPALVLTFVISDAGGSGVDPTSFRASLDGDDLEGLCVVNVESAECHPFPVPHGIHQVHAQVADNAGNRRGLSFAFERVADNQPPAVAILSPDDGALVNTPVLAVAGTVSDDVAVDRVEFNGVPATLTGGTFSALVPLTEGSNSLFAVAYDVAGKFAVDDIQVALDTKPPVLDVTAPVSGQTTHAETIVVSGTVHDDRGVAAVSVAGQSSPIVDQQFTNSVAIPEGTSTIDVVATDLAGNATSAAIAIERRSVPLLVITTPVDATTVAPGTLAVTGMVEGSSAVTVNGVPAAVDGTTFSATIETTPPRTVIDAVAMGSAGHVVTDTATVFTDIMPPIIHVQSPADGEIAFGSTVDISGIVLDPAIGALGAGDPTVLIGGVLAEVSHGSFLAASVLLAPGDNVIPIRTTDAAGQFTDTTFSIERVDPDGRVITITSGNHQSAPIHEMLPAPLVVEVRDELGQPLAGITVVFEVTSGDGRLGADDRRRLAVGTNAAGQASAPYRLGHQAGPGAQRIRAAAAGVLGSATFSVRAVPGPAALIVVDAGAEQDGIAGRPLPAPLVAAVTDAGFNRLPGHDVTFRVTKGTGALDGGATEITLQTDAEGRAAVSWTLDDLAGEANNVVDAFLGSEPDAPFASFVASGRTIGPAQETTFQGIVLDNSGQPVPGVSVHATGATRSVQTAADGTFALSGLAPGTVHLDIDGATAQRPGSWPHLTFETTVLSGRVNSLGRPIYLLPLDESGLTVGPETGGMLALEDYPGFSLEIGPGSVTFPDGSSSGIVGATVVHLDKVPMAPSFGQQPLFVVTIQPSGAIFDPPAKLTLPNLEGLPAGAVTPMYSFDHELGRFVSIGPGAVSSDALTIASLPNFGVREAGWHCGGNPAATGAPHDCPECQRCNGSQCVADDTQGCDFDSACYLNDRCAEGRCTGDRRQLISVEATANGQGTVVVEVGETVDFVATVDHQDCEFVSGSWDFGPPEQPEGTATFGPIMLQYDEPGPHPFYFDATCNGDCDAQTDQGLVLVRCPEVKIISRDPDIDVMCPACTMLFEAEVSPPALAPTLEWDIGIGENRAFLSGIDELQAEITARDTDRGPVVVRAFLPEYVEDCGEAQDFSAVEVFVGPENRPMVQGMTPGEIAIGLGLLLQASQGSFQAGACLDLVLGLKPIANAATASLWSCGHEDRSPSNALLHALGNCIVASVCGAELATDLFDAHENFTGVECSRTYLDLHNNPVGVSGATPGQPEACSDAIHDAMVDGQLLWQDTPGSEDCPLNERLQNILEQPLLSCLVEP